jgi:hypothetical protein
VKQEAKQMAGRINEPADLWDLEHYLTQRRKEIDRSNCSGSSRSAAFMVAKQQY